MGDEGRQRSGALFAAYREAAGLTIAKCGVLLEVDPRTIRSWEADKYAVPDGVWPVLEGAVQRVVDLSELIVSGQLARIDRGDGVQRAAAALAVQDSSNVFLEWD